MSNPRINGMLPFVGGGFGAIVEIGRRLRSTGPITCEILAGGTTPISVVFARAGAFGGAFGNTFAHDFLNVI